MLKSLRRHIMMQNGRGGFLPIWGVQTDGNSYVDTGVAWNGTEIMDIVLYDYCIPAQRLHNSFGFRIRGAYSDPYQLYCSFNNIENSYTLFLAFGKPAMINSAIFNFYEHLDTIHIDSISNQYSVVTREGNQYNGSMLSGYFQAARTNTRSMWLLSVNITGQFIAGVQENTIISTYRMSRSDIIQDFVAGILTRPTTNTWDGLLHNAGEVGFIDLANNYKFYGNANSIGQLIPIFQRP